MFLRVILLSLSLIHAHAYAAPPSDTQPPSAHAKMLAEFLDRSISNDARYVRLKEHYAAAEETLRNADAASDEGLRAAFSMSEVMLLSELAYSQPLPQRYVADMSTAFKELSRRGSDNIDQRNSMIGAHLSIWQIEEAKALTTDETRTKRHDVVALEGVDAFDPTATALVLLSGKNGTARAMPFEFPEGPMIVVSAGCHIARRAADAIYADPLLSEAFRASPVLWLSPSSTTVDPVALDEWNSSFPNAQMHVAFDNSKWQGVDFARLPSFHFYMNGKLVTRINGWSDDIVAREKILAASESIGIAAPKVR